MIILLRIATLKIRMKAMLIILLSSNEEFAKITGIDRAFELNNEVLSQSGFQGFSAAISSAAEGQIDTGQMMSSLLKKAQELGILILNSTEVLSIDKHEASVVNKVVVKLRALASCAQPIASNIHVNVVADRDIERSVVCENKFFGRVGVL